jgi:hypothetical protein
MGSILVTTLLMFVMAFVISMLVALLIYWIRNLLTSVRMNSLFDEKSKILVKRARRIHKIHDLKISMISEEVEHDIYHELSDFYRGINDDVEQPDDYHGELKPIVRSTRNPKKTKISKP